MNLLTNIHSRLLCFVMIIGSIFLFAPFVQTVILTSFIAVMAPDKMPLFAYLLVLGESFMYGYYLHIPAAAFLAFGVYGLKRA